MLTNEEFNQRYGAYMARLKRLGVESKSPYDNHEFKDMVWGVMEKLGEGDAHIRALILQLGMFEQLKDETVINLFKMPEEDREFNKAATTYRFTQNMYEPGEKGAEADLKRTSINLAKYLVVSRILRHKFWSDEYNRAYPVIDGDYIGHVLENAGLENFAADMRAGVNAAYEGGVAVQ
jgi:hypothetical protein